MSETSAERPPADLEAKRERRYQAKIACYVGSVCILTEGEDCTLQELGRKVLDALQRCKMVQELR